MVALPLAEAQITAERQERKYAVPRDRVKRFVAAMDAQLGRHRFTGDGANRLPGAHHFVTTIYFDTAARDVFRSAAGAERSLKIRAKEYYDLHPSLTPLARDPRDLVRYQPVLWLEVKERDGDVTAKKRVVLPKARIPEFLAGEYAEIPGTPEAREVGRVCRGFASPLGAACLVNYRRLAWQSTGHDVRVTLDVGLGFFRPPADLWSRRHALVREALGAPAGEESSGIIEIKTLDGLPGALAAALDAVGAQRVPYSKFESASRAVHG
jgi:hypothetical protein